MVMVDLRVHWSLIGPVYLTRRKTLAVRDEVHWKAAYMFDDFTIVYHRVWDYGDFTPVKKNHMRTRCTSGRTSGSNCASGSGAALGAGLGLGVALGLGAALVKGAALGAVLGAALGISNYPVPLWLKIVDPSRLG